jgi:glycosyltransferase involved in cell wall biosynthesis
MTRTRSTILVIGPARFAATAPFAGGLESFVGSLANGLRRKSHRVQLVAGVRPPDSTTAHRRDVPHSPAEAEADGEALRNAVGEVLDRYHVDVIHNNASSPQVLDFVDSVPNFEMTLHTPPLPDVVQALLRRPHLNLSTPSHSNASGWADQLGRPPDVILNGVDRTVFVPQEKGPPYLAWAGRIVREKGLHLAIQAASLLEMRLRIAGPIHDLDYFHTEIRPHLGGATTYEGHMSPPQLAELFGRATATLVTPLWPEPFGLVVVESLACGTPVAGFANGALGPGSPFPDELVAVTDDVSADALAGAVLRTLQVLPTQCRRASEPFDLRHVVSAYERRYGVNAAQPG